MIPRIEPTAAPISVFRVARRIRSSKMMMQMAINAPAPAEIHGSSPTGTSLYPATTKIAVNISRIKNDIGMHNKGILPRPYRQRHGDPWQLSPFMALCAFKNTRLNDAMRIPTLLVLIALACWCAQHCNTQQSLKFTVPAGWVEEERTSSMRVAQYRLPKAAGDTEDASLVLYYFGQGQGGSTAANIERWVGQMKQADGSASKGQS